MLEEIFQESVLAEEESSVELTPTDKVDGVGGGPSGRGPAKWSILFF